MAKNTGNGRRIGQVKDRYQLKNERTGFFDKYDGLGNFIASKSSPGPWKSVEKRNPKKPPRG
ncbi:hypothetical protein [Arthrobacter sedimenti]|uniref:HNH endonuclease n=1 Tax=Arthrobacter sedimenti TaxID=2694931 RepID=A0ABV8WPF0_9MICC